MMSLRLWLVGMALGAALVFVVPLAKAQMPRGITYQGVLEQNGVPFSGTVSMQFTFSDKIGNVLATETDPTVVVTNGVFNEVLGPLPESLTFDEQYSMTIVVTAGNGTPTTLPAVLLWSSPYALNAERVGGITVSATPVNGDIFPIPLDSNGRIAASRLPSEIATINGVSSDNFQNFEINAGLGVTITPGTNSITINSSAASLITSVTGTNGITGGGSAGNVILGIGYGAITSNMLNPNIGLQSLTAENSSSALPAMVALDSETNGNAALAVRGGISANNPTGAADGSGLASGSSQTYWADEVSVPTATGSSLVIYNTLVGPFSTIVITPVGIAAVGGGLTVTSQSAGTFTVSSKNPMGTGGGGVMTALNYIIVNH